jgi:hypothetical protein
MRCNFERVRSMKNKGVATIGQSKERKLRHFLIPFSLSLILVCFVPYLLTQYSFVDFDLSLHGSLGDAIGGLTGPVIAAIAAVLTFCAFWVQYRANEQQRKDIALERFEKNFYELVHLHKSNVNEMTIGDQLQGRRIFAALFDELRFTYFVVEKVINDYFPGSDDDKEKDAGFRPDDAKIKLIIAYLVFFYGTGIKSSKISIESLKGYCTLEFINALGSLMDTVKTNFRASEKQKREVALCREGTDMIYVYSSLYAPFEGHAARLSHYYRHLYQVVKYVDGTSALERQEQKYGYVKTLRAQLSNYEQILLCYNALTPLGSGWLTCDGAGDSLLVRYKLIRNIPLPLLDFGIDITEEFKDAMKANREKRPPEEFFEWHETRAN